MSDAEIIDAVMKSAPAMKSRIVALIHSPVPITARVDALLNGQTIIPKDEPNRELWTISRTGRELNIGRGIVRKLIAAGELETVDVPFGHPSNRMRITATSVDAYRARLCKGAAHE